MQLVFQVQALRVLVNLSSNPDMMDDIVQVQVKVIGVFSRISKMLFKSET